MKKKKLLVGLLAAGAVIALASCGGNDPKPVDPTTTQTATAKNLGQKVKVTFMNVDPDDATKKEEKEVTLDKVDASTNTAYGTVEAPKPTNAYKTFAGWFSDAELKNAANVTAITGESTFYAKWTPIYEEVTTGVGNNEGLTSWAAAQALSDATGTAAFTKDVTVGNITFVSNGKAKFEEKNKVPVINTQGTNIKVVLSGEGNNNEIKADGLFASSTATQRIYLYKAGVEEAIEQTEEFSGSDTPVSFDWKDLEAGEYTIKCSASIRYYNIFTIQKKEKSPVTGITVETGAVSEYLVGDEFDTTGLVVKKNYKNGSTDTVDLEALTVDTSAVNFNEAGEYTVTYTLTDTDFSATQKVKVFAVESLRVEDYILSNSRQTKNLETVFIKGGEFTHANLAVTAIGKVTVDNVEVTKEFALEADQFTVGTVDLTTAGEKDVTVTCAIDETKTATYKVVVFEKELVESYDNVVVTVDPVATECAVNGFMATVKTINQALALIEASDLADSVLKAVLVKPGTYKEKVEITTPNVLLINDALYAQNGIDINKTLEENEAVIIEYDALAGYYTNNNVKHSTDGSATVSVRSTAKDFTAFGIGFKNYYNTHELYTESKKLFNDTQAVALLVEADHSLFVNCGMSSYHDTLYAREGRQLYVNCYIEGRTDYIFGDRDVTALFENCIIHTLGANQDKNGGYVACNKGSKVDLAYIFNNCTFEADQATEDGKGVADATVSLGRTWDEKMRLVIMNSTISAAYAKADFGATTEGGKNTRYTEMNKGKSPSKDRIFEYNNTGDGALAPTDAADYTSVSVVAGITTDNAKYISSALATVFSNNGTKEWGATWLAYGLTLPVSSEGQSQELGKAIGLQYEVAIIELKYAQYNGGTRTLVGGYLSEDYLREVFTAHEDRYDLLGFYSDSALTTKFDFTKAITGNTVIYLKVAKQAEEIDLVPYDGKTDSLDTTWTVTGEKVQNVSPTVGGTQDSSDAVEVHQFAKNEGVKNAEAFENGANKVKLVMLSASIGTSKAINAIVNLYAQDGTTLVKTQKWENVTADKKTASAEITITSEDAFFFVEVLYGGYEDKDDKHFAIYSLEATIYVNGEEADSSVPATTLKWGADNVVKGENGAEVVLNAFVKAVPVSDKLIEIDSNSKTLDGVTYTHRLKLAGTIAENGNYVEVDLSSFTGKATIKVVAISGAGSSATSDIERPLQIFEGTPKTGTKVAELTIGNTGVAALTTSELACGKKYYIGSGLKGMNIYEITITPVSSQSGENTEQQVVASIKSSDLTESSYAGDGTVNFGTVFTLFGNYKNNAYQTVSVSSASGLTVDGETSSISKVLKVTGGKAEVGENTKNAIKIVVDKTVTITAVVSQKDAGQNDDGTPKTPYTAKLVLLNASGEKVKSSTNAMDAFGSTSLTTITFENIEAGTYYLGADGSGFLLFDLEVLA